tara:strand:- start:2307 stop:2834 length:528 start_codon:yes stop_codon:yes gene_type:complete
MSIEQFFALSQGNWKSMRSSHSLAFQDFEDIKSNIKIKELNLLDKSVLKLNQILNKTDNHPACAIKIDWNSSNEWDPEEKASQGETILIAVPHSDNQGIFLRSKGYIEENQSISTYNLIKEDSLTLQTSYKSTITEERIWFVSSNVRCRYSLVKSINKSAIFQTSFSSEIRIIND